MIRNLYWFSYNVPVIPVPQIFKHTQISNFMKIHPVVTELFHANSWTDRKTDRHNEANVAFRNFANSPRKEPLFSPDKYSNFPEFVFRLYSDGN